MFSIFTKRSIKKLSLMAVLIVGLSYGQVTLNAQVEGKVSVGGTANAKDVWYSLDNGQVKEQAAFDWDLAFGAAGYDASIFTNDAKGVILYYVGDDYSEEVDIADLDSWTRYINSDSTWQTGSLNARLNPADAFDYGWGKYNMASHNVVGEAVYVVKLADGVYKKLFIDMLQSSKMKYQFLISDLDGSNEEEIIVDYSQSKSNFLYFDFTTKQVVEREPASADWQLQFGRYYTTIQGEFYPVVGVRTNGNVLSTSIDFEDDQMAAQPQKAPNFAEFHDKISYIGYEWKAFTGTEYKISSNRAYFVQKYKTVNAQNIPDGDVYQITFTGYKGGADGEISFILNKANPTSVNDNDGSKFFIYPNEVNSGENPNLIISSIRNSHYVMNITDLLGNQVFSQEVDVVTGLNQINIPLQVSGSLAKGMYFVNLVNDTNFNQVKFIVK